MQTEHVSKLADWILGELRSNKHLTTDCVVEAWMIDVGEPWIRDTLEMLRDDGKIRLSPDGSQWMLRTTPRVVAEVGGDQTGDADE